MFWETLPSWFWTIYYLFLIATFGTAIFSFKKNHNKILSIVVIIFTVTIPTVSLINSIGRAEGMNEFEHLISRVQQGAMWSIFTIIGYLFLIIWWVIFVSKGRKKTIYRG